MGVGSAHARAARGAADLASPAVSGWRGGRDDSGDPQWPTHEPDHECGRQRDGGAHFQDRAGADQLRRGGAIHLFHHRGAVPGAAGGSIHIQGDLQAGAGAAGCMVAADFAESAAGADVAVRAAAADVAAGHSLFDFADDGLSAARDAGG